MTEEVVAAMPGRVVSGLALVCLIGTTTLTPSESPGGRGTATSPTSFANFESPQARSLAISADGSRLYAVNTPAHSVSVYSLGKPKEPVLIKEIPVGLDPVSVALRSRDEVWVVNHVSDSVSVVDMTREVVVDTIRVGDRPGDVVFAGTPQRAFVSSMTERAVSVIDPDTRRVVKIIPLCGSDPRTLLASEDGRSVWVAIGRSGNKTTVVPHTMAPPPPAVTNEELPAAPRQGIIVDCDDPIWKRRIDVTLPDHDVVEIDVASLTVRRSYQGVGTILFNLARRPGTDELWVANTHARNLVRFEPGLRGHVIDSQITRIATGAAPGIFIDDLNAGIDYRKLPNAEALSTALAQPTDVVFDGAGQVAYVAAFGTDRIGVLDAKGSVTARIEVGETPGDVAAPRTKRGPRSLAHHPGQNVLYVLNRLSNTLSVIDTTTREVVREVGLFDPTPPSIREGRGFLFDAKLSGNGTVSCASCHVDADRDGLAWDLGDPGGRMFSNGSQTLLHPMKGPLLTQSLRGLLGERIFHWRADRPGLASFNAAFHDLLGGQHLGAEDLSTFVRYLRSIRFAPNPNRNLDDTLPATPVGVSARDGERIFLTKNEVGREGSTRFRCVGCHGNETGSGAFGFSGLIGQPTKAAQLRGLHERRGRKPTEEGRASGFGYGADGSKDDLPAFLSSAHRFSPLTANEKTALERFLFAFPTETAPVVGFTRTVTAANAKATAVVTDLHLLVGQAELGRCDLVVKGLLDDRHVGFVYDAVKKSFARDSTGLAPLTMVQLTSALGQAGSVLTFVAVPPRSGRRLGIDRDADGTLDGDGSLAPTDRREDQTGKEEHWSQFRGPNGDGKGLATDLPVEFSETRRVRWKTPIHDKGWSSPVVWGDRIWLTTGRWDGSQLFAICVDFESGKVVHDIKVFDVEQPPPEYPELNSHATPTPVVEDGRVYVHFGSYGTACLDTRSGEKLWERRDLRCDHRVRPASSPIIGGDSLFLTFDGVDKQFIVALDKATGKTLWLQHRRVDSDFIAVLRAQGVENPEEAAKEKPNDNRKSYATPTIIEHQGKRQLISPAAEVTISYDPETGKELWRVRHQGWGWNVACRPVYEHGLVFLTTGVARTLLAVRPSGTGDVTDTHVVWRTRKSTSSISSPLIVDDLLFMISDGGGIVSCLEAKSGRQVWRERLGGIQSHWASPVCSDGKIYFFSKEGRVSVISAAREFQLLAANKFDRGFNASPAIVDDAMILRSLTHLYRIEK